VRLKGHLFLIRRLSLISERVNIVFVFLEILSPKSRHPLLRSLLLEYHSCVLTPCSGLLTSLLTHSKITMPLPRTAMSQEQGADTRTRSTINNTLDNNIRTQPSPAALKLISQVRFRCDTFAKIRNCFVASDSLEFDGAANLT
jgi:hypothetical protein